MNPSKPTTLFHSTARRLALVAAYLRQTARRRRMPAGAMAGLSLVAVACLSIGTVSYQAFGPRDVIAHRAMAEPA